MPELGKPEVGAQFAIVDIVLWESRRMSEDRVWRTSLCILHSAFCTCTLMSRRHAHVARDVVSQVPSSLRVIADSGPPDLRCRVTASRHF